MAIIYKTLFEIRLTHEYFLTRSNGTVIFEKLTQPERLTFLEEEFAANSTAINEDVAFEFPRVLQPYYESRYLRLLPSYSGCKVAIRVKPKILPDTSIVYEPFIPLKGDENVIVNINRKNFDIDAYTNSRINIPCLFTYCFTNQEILSSLQFPFLTNAIAPIDSSIVYEQGELVKEGTQVKEFYNELVGNLITEKWRPIAGQAFANEKDRLLLGRRFEYIFPDTRGLTEAIFILKDFEGNELKRFEKRSAHELNSKSSIDFSEAIKPLPLQSSLNLKEQLSQLEVNGNNGYSARHKILFCDELLEDKPWGVVITTITTSDPSFNLLASDGFLHKRKDSAGVMLPAPFFEIPVKSRLVYFRYNNDKGKDLNPGATISNYVRKEGKGLVTKNPRPISKAWFKLRKEGSTDTEYIPNPVSYSLKIERDRRLFFDLKVPRSELFQELP